VLRSIAIALTKACPVTGFVHVTEGHEIGLQAAGFADVALETLKGL
jgi:hypothetical protein